MNRFIFNKQTKQFVWAAFFLSVMGLVSGCHSGIMRGAGSDMSRMGDSLQK